MNEGVVHQLFSAQSQIDAGNYEAALQMCQAIVDANASCLLARRIMAALAVESGELDKAIEAFRVCSLIDPEDEVAHVGLAMCADALDDHDTASAELRRALELAPTDRWIAEEVERRGDQVHRTPLMEAREALIAENPVRAMMSLGEHTDRSDLAVELTRAQALWQLGRYDAVWDLCWTISRQHPTCVGALIMLKAAGTAVDKPLFARMAARMLEQITPGLDAYSLRINAPGLQVS